MEVKILDGGVAAQLSTHVREKIDGHPLWTARFLATNPDAVSAMHLDFLRAGSDIIVTNTYQASVPGLMKHLSITEQESIQLLHKAVELARKAVDVYTKEIEGNNSIENRNPIIAGGCGPYGASLHDGSEYSGIYGKSTPHETMIEWHRLRVNAFVDAGLTLLAFETIPCYQEAEAIVELMREYPNMKMWLSFSCAKDGPKIVDGSNFQEVATRCYRAALPGQIVAVGANCLDAKLVTPLFKDINKGTGNVNSLLKGINESNEEFVPLVVYPNSGEVYSTEKECWVTDEGCVPIERYIPEWLDLGVRYLGGCCRMFAPNITSIRKKVKECSN